MIQEKLQRKNEFVITVKYHGRNYSYKVKQQLVSEEEQVFNIIASQKTVVLTSKRQQFCNQVKQVYTYDDQKITNKCLMNRIIEAIDNSNRKVLF